MKRIRGFHVTDEEKAYLERYLRVIRECPEEKVFAVTRTVDIYFEHLQNQVPGYKKKEA